MEQRQQKQQHHSHTCYKHSSVSENEQINNEMENLHREPDIRPNGLQGLHIQILNELI